ncbi:Uncharacterised protein [uncultured archaeon]|nr:Uncharacterised protein [uncultured archaeon]
MTSRGKKAKITEPRTAALRFDRSSIIRKIRTHSTREFSIT